MCSMWRTSMVRNVCVSILHGAPASWPFLRGAPLVRWVECEMCVCFLLIMSLPVFQLETPLGCL